MTTGKTEIPAEKSPITTEINGDVAIVWIDNPPVNVLSHAVRQGIFDAIHAIEADDNIKAALLACKGRTFIAGADIREFNQPAEPPLVTDIAAAMEQSKKPWTALLHGTTLGGGLETALGCHYRIAAADGQLGFPEVNLGIFPGAGGTVRLPRLIGYRQSVAMITSGKPISAEQALEAGLVDMILPETEAEAEARLQAALTFVKNSMTARLPTPCSQQPWPDLPEADFWQQKHDDLRRKRMIAPLQALETMQAAHKMTFSEAMQAERKNFIALRDSEQSRALRHVFFAERSAMRPAILRDVTPKTMKQIAVIGGGLMGCGIAVCIVKAGYECVLLEQNEQAAQAAEKRVTGILTRDRQQNRLTEQGYGDAIARFSTEHDSKKIADADMAIEAIYEDFQAKEQVFTILSEILKPDAIIASNTSYLDINALAETSGRAESFLGLHFFSPANIMKLTEVVRGDKTDLQTLASGFRLARKIGKIPVITGVCEGFIGNRLIRLYREQAEKLLWQGLTPEIVDRALTDFGMAMGVFAVQDMAGLDIAWRIREAAREKGLTPAPSLLDRLCEAGRLGQKSGGGWYDYSEGERTPKPSKIVPDMIKKFTDDMAITLPENGEITEADIPRHIFLPMYREGQRIIEEGIAQSAEDIDLVMIHGYGFPRWRGGLMYYGRLSAEESES